MGRTAEARAALAGILEPIWPGRVRPYPMSKPRPTAGVYIGELSAGWATDIDWAATFSVRVVADGNERAAHATLDDLLDAVYDAAAASDAFYPDAFSWDPVDIDGVTELPAYTFTVRVDLAAATWCAPDPPTAITIPPTPIGA